MSDAQADTLAQDQFRCRADRAAARLSGDEHGVRQGRFRPRSVDEILPTLELAKKLIVEHRVPVIVEVILERVTNVSMGQEIDAITEFEGLAASGADAPTAVYANLN